MDVQVQVGDITAGAERKPKEGAGFLVPYQSISNYGPAAPDTDTRREQEGGGPLSPRV